MKISKWTFSTSLFIVLGASIILAPNNTDVCGIYYSKKPSLMDKIAILYPKGHFKFFYSNNGQQKLEIKADSTFSFYYKEIDSLSNVSGKWKVEENRLVLEDTANIINHTRIEFLIRKQSVYRLRTGTLCENNQKIIFLDFLRK
jgi:hypothetical protein